MQDTASIVDRDGNAIAIGDEVRVLGISLDSDIEDDEREMFEFMIGAICEVERFDSSGRAWVTMWWSCGDGNATTSIALERHQMLRVRR